MVKSRKTLKIIKGKGPRKRYNWDNLKELVAKNTTIAEIARIKGCEWLTVKNALVRLGIEPLKKPRKHLKRKLVEPLFIDKAASELLDRKLECSGCQQPLIIIPWNRITRMAFCVNSGCRLCHMPVIHPILKLKEVSDEKILET